MILSWLLTPKSVARPSSVPATAADDVRSLRKTLSRVGAVPALVLDVVAIVFGPFILAAIVGGVSAAVFIAERRSGAAGVVVLAGGVGLLWGISWAWRRQLPRPAGIRYWQVEFLYLIQAAALLIFLAPVVSRFVSPTVGSFLAEGQQYADLFGRWLLTYGLAIGGVFFMGFVPLFLLSFVALRFLMPRFGLGEAYDRAFILAWSLTFAGYGIALALDGQLNEFAQTASVVDWAMRWVAPWLEYVAVVPVAYYLRQLLPSRTA